MRTLSATFASITLLAAAATSAVGQVDLNPGVAEAMHASRDPAGAARFHGAWGFLNYENPAQASAQPDPLMSLTADAPEPAASMLPYQSRGQRVVINWAQLDSIQRGDTDRAAMPLFDGESIELVFVHSEVRAPNRYTWFGQIAGVPASDFILTRHDDALYMVVRDYDRKKTYELQFAAARDGLPPGPVLRKTADLRPQTQCGTCAAAVADADLPSPQTGGGSRGYGSRSAADPANVIDVMIFCTDEARNFFGSESNFLANAQAAVDDANLRNSNSGTGLTVRLVYASSRDAAYSETPSGNTDLSRLHGTTDGYMDNVHLLRSQYRADLVCLLRLSMWDCSDTGCTAGLGNRPSVLPAFTEACTLCSLSGGALGLVFSHEIGHNMGACHDQGHGGCGGSLPQFAAAPHGFVLVCSQSVCDLRWHTTMAYQTNSTCDSSTPVPFYSNPGVSFDPPGACVPAALGDGASNVTNLIQLARPYVSQYTIGSTQVWASYSVLGGGNGTRLHPYAAIQAAVSAVAGSTAEGRVLALPGTYQETLGGARRQVLSNPCVLEAPSGTVVFN